MHYTATYHSPLGNILLAADDEGLIGLWFQGQKFFAQGLAKDAIALETPVLQAAMQWLDGYFSGVSPCSSLPLRPQGTPFQQAIWQLLLEIPYGQTLTYGQLARQYATKTGLASMSAQAVGNAVGRNPIALLIPCHRVVGAKGTLTGYAGGVDKKHFLLQLEKAI